MILTKEILCKIFQHVFHFHPISSALIFQAWVSGISKGKGEKQKEETGKGEQTLLSLALSSLPLWNLLSPHP